MKKYDLNGYVIQLHRIINHKIDKNNVINSKSMWIGRNHIELTSKEYYNRYY